MTKQRAFFSCADVRVLTFVDPSALGDCGGIGPLMSARLGLAFREYSEVPRLGSRGSGSRGQNIGGASFLGGLVFIRLSEEEKGRIWSVMVYREACFGRS